jgi:hypothetical protein
MRKLIVNDGTFDRELQLVERLVIGRDPECDLSDTNTLLSRRHAEFIAAGNEVTVRDLGSRNGVFINGARVAESRVRPGDVVRIGHFSIKYVEAADLNDPRRTEATVAFPLDDPPPELRHLRPAAAVAGSSAAVAAVAAPAAVVAPAARPMPVSPEPSARHERHVPAAAVVETEERPGNGFVLLHVAAAAIVGFLSAAIPMFALQTRSQTTAAEQQGEALAEWLGAEASGAISSGASAASAADVVSRQPGVVNAAVLAVDGSVLSPRSRAGESVGTIPGLGLNPSDVRAIESAWSGDRRDVARPIESADGRRVGVAWITLQPTGSLLMSTLVVWLAFPIVVVLLASWVAADLIGRRVGPIRKA